MKEKEVRLFEGLMAQLSGLYEEIQSLVKKDPNDAVNEFKLGVINSVIRSVNSFLGEKLVPVAGFTEFVVSSVPTTSDVLLVLSQYLSYVEKIRADNIGMDEYGNWYWVIDGEMSRIDTSPPRKLGQHKKGYKY